MQTRRDFLSSAAAVAALGAGLGAARAAAEETYPAPGHPGRRILVRGKEIYVDVSGPEGAPAVAHIHGGPGTGAYTFELYQRERLSQRLRVVSFDQRGALRSEAVGADEPFTMHDLVEDTEALREALGIKRWSVIAHSFGGLIATRYALAYPRSVRKLVFDNPTFDIASSDRSMLYMIAEGYREAGMPERAAEAIAAAERSSTPREVWRDFTRLGAGLGLARRLDLYAYSLPPGYFFQWMRESGLPEENWLRGSGPSQETLWRDDAVFEDLRPQFPKVRASSLLIKGRHDFNTPADQLEAFDRKIRRSRIAYFENTAHLAYAEEPDLFAEVVTDFLS